MELRDDFHMGMILITHDMGVVAETADDVTVMYAGQIVEQQDVFGLFDTPHHPYTNALLAALPERSHGQKVLPTIAGVVPGKYDRPPGCLFNPRCTLTQERCCTEPPQLLEIDTGKYARCFFPVNKGA